MPGNTAIPARPNTKGWPACSRKQLTSKPAPCPKAIIHGWKDDVVPVENSIRFAREHSATLHILDSDHRLHNELPLVNYLFEFFLVSLDLPKRR